MIFADRIDAGERLAKGLAHLAGSECVVLAIPGGIGKPQRIAEYAQVDGVRGFPTTVAELSAFVSAMSFDHIGVFTYSHEEGTRAGAWEDDVPPATKRKGVGVRHSSQAPTPLTRGEAE